MRRGAAALLLVLGCGDGDPVPTLETRREVVHAGAPHRAHVSEPALALRPDGTPVLAWVRDDASGRHIGLLVVDAEDPAAGGIDRAAQAGDAAVRVDPDSHPVARGHQAPGLGVGPDGRVHVSWSSPRHDPDGSPFASDLVLASAAGGQGFSAPLRLHEDRAGTRGFEGMAVDAAGGVLVAWIEGGAQAATRLARVDGGRVSEPVALGRRTCPCCRVAVAAGDGQAGVLWRDELPGRVRDMVLALSSDAGLRFSPAARVHDDGWSLDACPHRGGALAFDAGGRALVAWYTEGRAGRPSLRLAAGGAAGFGAPLAIHDEATSMPDRVALAVARDGSGLVLFERRTPVRSEIAARAILDEGRRLGPVRVLSRGVHARGPVLAASPSGGFVAAWNEEAFPTLRTVVSTLTLAVE